VNNPVRGATWSACANPPPSPSPDDGGRDGAGLSCEIAACKAIARSPPAVVGVDESAAESAAGDESKGERSSLEAESMGLHAVRTRQPGRARARFSGAASRQEGRVTCLDPRLHGGDDGMELRTTHLPRAAAIPLAATHGCLPSPKQPW